MAKFDTLADRRDGDAAERDDAAVARDLVSAERDADAELRDARADDRADAAGRRAADLDERLAGLRRQILDRLARIESLPFDEADWLDLTPASLARLHRHVTEQRRLAAVDRDAIRALLDDLRAEVQRNRADRSAAAADRLAAARDRHAALTDRCEAARDRDQAARDRAQAVIEREQADPPDGSYSVTAARQIENEPLIDRVERAISESRQRIAASREFLSGGGGHADPAAAESDDPGEPGRA